jgi:hypothetical protein
MIEDFFESYNFYLVIVKNLFESHYAPLSNQDFHFPNFCKLEIGYKGYIKPSHSPLP